MSREHTDKEYEQDLRRLREELLLMAGHCEDMIALAIESLIQGDSELARRTMDEDCFVDEGELRADELCMLILAKRQPVASDLRFITQALKMSTELERVGDLAVNVCERVLLLNEEPQLKPYEDLPRMAALAQSMIREAIDAFVNEDAEKADSVIRKDDEVDRLYQRIVTDLLKIMTDNTAAVRRGIHINAIAKFLERMADHGTNLAEQVIFMLKGQDRRHPHEIPNRS